MKKNSAQFEATLQQAIALYPVKLKYPVVWETKKFAHYAEYHHFELSEYFANITDENNQVYHLIKFNPKMHENSAELLNTFLHELIHAEQSELNIDTDHGDFFCERVMYFARLGLNAASCECDLQLLIQLGWLDYMKAE